MFESSQFLSLWLPEYFRKVYLSTNQTQAFQNSPQTDLNILARFLKFSSKMYDKLGVKNQFSLFLMNEFACLNPQKNEKNSNFSNPNIKKRQGILEKIEQKVLDKFTLNSIQLFLKFFKIQIDIQNQSSDFFSPKKSMKEISEMLLKAMEQTRFQFQQYRMQNYTLREYDCYAKQIFEEIIESPDQIGDKMKQILQYVLTDQCTNIDERVVDHLMKLLDPKQLEQAKQLQNVQNLSYNELRKNFSKKTKKIQKQRCDAPRLRKKSIDGNKPQFQSPKSPKSPRKLSNVQFSPFPLHRSPTNRIKNYAKNKKQKELDKKRTIYCQRKSMYLPKLRDLFDKMTCFASQTTVSVQDRELKKTEKKVFKFDKNMNHNEDESENVLVRSTPKQNKRLMSNIKIISHKLDFC